MIRDRRAQSAVWGFLGMMVFIAIASGLVDIYRLYAARNWAYTVAQEAAMAGASRGRDWSSMLVDGNIRLDPDMSRSQALAVIDSAMSSRGVVLFVNDVRVLPDPGGGVITGYPPQPVRLASGAGNWHSSEPAVGVYLEVPVNWLMLNMLNLNEKTVRVFAAAGVAH
ncbi:hypothetical protein LARV_00966 [Longilinea arvoryzae]|uniref:Flp pilus-assembly TadE/G-like n=1 Tax=Longilinea arvoryzae TaxID=360412 RepID=A0A0S7B7B3_9CHLR|nr:hypothetical protein [Longilinea arvoryzae]GAP13215.1 hypothetical protein LARV_00966 [Longilinea arvoryzae]